MSVVKWPPETIPDTFDWWWSGVYWYCSLAPSNRFGIPGLPPVSGAGRTQVAAFQDCMKAAEKMIKRKGFALQNGPKHE